MRTIVQRCDPIVCVPQYHHILYEKLERKREEEEEKKLKKDINLSERIISLLAFYEKFLFWAKLQSRIVARPYENGRDEVLFSFPFRFVQHTK